MPYSKIQPTTPRLSTRGFLVSNAAMKLPTLKSGHRFTLPHPLGSADALLLARLGAREKASGKLVAIVTSDAVTAQRLIDEISFFEPALRCALFPVK